jgi:hypothetical protein
MVRICRFVAVLGLAALTNNRSTGFGLPAETLN